MNILSENINSKQDLNNNCSKKKFLVVHKNDIEFKLNITTNLFSIDNGIKFIYKIGNSIFLYGIIINQICPKDNEIYEINYMRQIKKKRLFHEMLDQIFEIKTINGLTLFGKLKNKIDLNIDLKKFFLVYESDNENNDVKYYFVNDKKNVIEDKNKKIIILTFIQKFTLLTYHNLNLEKENKENYLIKNFLNVCISKLLFQNKYKRDDFSKKAVYYKISDFDISKNTLPLLNEEKYYNNCKPLYIPGLKAICNIYDKNTIYLKLLPKNIIYNENTYSELYNFYCKHYENKTKEEINKIFIDTCLNKKGIKIYSGETIKIEELIFENPFNCKFINSDGKETNVGEYYYNKFNIKLKQSMIPLAVRYIDKNGKIPKNLAKKIIIPCELLYVVGNLFNKKINIKGLVQKPIEKYKNILEIRKKILEAKNINQISNFLENIFNGNFEQKKIKCYKLKSPILEFKNIRREPNDNGSINIIDTIPYSGNPNLKTIEVFLLGVNEEEGQNLFNQIKIAGNSLGITINQPYVEIIKEDLDKENLYFYILDLLNYLKQKYKEKIDISFLFLNRKYRDKYKQFKKAFNNSERKIPTQVILCNENNNNNLKQNLSKFTLILNQIWGKKGDELYKCDFSFIEDPIIISYSCLRIEKNKILTSLCISVNKKLCEYAFFSEITESEFDVPIYSINLEKILTKALMNIGKCMIKKNKNCKNIIIYRSGANEQMMNFLINNELQLILNSIDKVKKELSLKGSQEKKNIFSESKLCWIIVNKQCDIKMFLELEDDYNYIDNIPIGTIIDNEITSENYYDFYLNSTFTNQGTNSATHYTVLYDDTDLTANQIYKLTYYLTFLSFNNIKSIKIPAPLYFVEKRNNFIKNNLDGDNINSKVTLLNVTL